MSDELNEIPDSLAVTLEEFDKLKAEFDKAREKILKACFPEDVAATWRIE